MSGIGSAVQYKPVPGFPNYRVGDDGTVWSFGITTRGSRDGWYELRGGRDKDGYRKVVLCHDGKRRYFRVNVLILTVFVRPCEGKEVAAHQDNDKANNRLSNLQWSSQKQNIADKERHGTKLFGDTHPGSKLTVARVREILKRQAAGSVSPAAIAREFGVDAATICDVLQRRTWKHVQI